VNCVSPGYIATEMTTLGLASGWGETWLSLIPMGRLGEPVEVAWAVWYLASDAAGCARPVPSSSSTADSAALIVGLSARRGCDRPWPAAVPAPPAC
jgi:NAD(P)-dependent dehydrogenase (short-subunit alcohol dehydrogenase family)